MNIVIIGGGTAGTTAAFELRKQDKQAGITIIEASSYREYSPCSLPNVISREIKGFEDIIIFSESDYSDNKIDLICNATARSIDRSAKKVKIEKAGKPAEIKYDKLIIAAGSRAVIPPIKGIETVPYLTLRNIEDAKKISERAKPGKCFAIIGAGLIGVELAVALAARKCKAVLIDIASLLSAVLDEDMAISVRQHLESRSIQILEGQAISEAKSSSLLLSGGKIISFDELIVCAGVAPDLLLAQSCGLKTEKGIIVDSSMRTSDKDVYAIGDCIEIKDKSLRIMPAKLGSTAVRQARIVANNLCGKKEALLPATNAAISNIGIYIGSVGITQKQAGLLGIKTMSAVYEGFTKAEYHPAKKKIRVKIISDMKGKLVGAQIIGGEDVAGRIDMLSLAMQKCLGIEDIALAETCYSPASAPINDPVVICAGICLKKSGLI